jgi:AraC-like DNA-binding protein
MISSRSWPPLFWYSQMSAQQPLDGPKGLLNVSVQPQFLRHSGSVGWQGALFVEIVAAPQRVVDHVHRHYCLQRTQDAMRERRRGAGWRTVPIGWTLWLPEDELRAEWQGSTRAQFLFISSDRVDQLVDGRLLHDRPERRSRPEHTPVVQKLLDAMAADLASGSPAGSLVGDCLVTALCGSLSGSVRRNHKASGLVSAARRRVLERIEQDLDHPLTLADLAAEAGLGVRQFCRAFRASTGASPHQYVLERRIVRAQKLIAAGGMLAEVALQCGFADQSQLTRSFSRRVGLTPAAYRRTLER